MIIKAQGVRDYCCSNFRDEAPFLLLDIDLNSMQLALVGFMELGDCESLFRFGDKDKDGRISFEEFVLMIIPDEYHISEEMVNEVKKMDYYDLINS